MVNLEDIPQPENGFYVVITGANSGLGLAIGCRLIDEFLETRPQSQSLVLIATTRDKRKGNATIEHFREHLQKICRKHERSLPGITMLLQRRIFFRAEILDLTSIISVQKLSKRLRDTTPKLDSIICNAGIGGWDGLYWGKAIWTILTDWKNAVTWPNFKKSGVGWRTKPQIPREEKDQNVKEPDLGEVFCANLFGHYLLGHYLAPLLSRHDSQEQTRGRLIWVSSLEAYVHSFIPDDMQSIKSDHPYESSKRLTDLMGITSVLSSTAPLVDQYLEHVSDTRTTRKPRIYVTHPGICGTAIFTLPIVLEYLMIFVFYVARWMGSQWHGVSPGNGACAMVWLTLADQSTLDAMEARDGIGKWGSATDRWGNERVERTEVDGWGWGGNMGPEEIRKRGRRPGAKDLTEEDKKTFEETGYECWVQMEKLRLEWEKTLEDAGVAIKMD